MSMTINSFIIADVEFQGATLRSVLGAYELVFGLRLSVRAHVDNPLRASIIGARVSVSGGDNDKCAIGFARPESSFEIVTTKYPSSMTPSLVLPLHPGQLAALEERRGIGDLDFELLVEGLGIHQSGSQPVQDTWRLHIPRSDWIKKLRAAGARNTLLIEVPLPVIADGDAEVAVPRHLHRAEEQFRLGDYHACIASCRTVVQELGHRSFGKEDWAGSFMSRISTNRSSMTKTEREAALWATLRHYTHQAHHAEGEGGMSDYSRSEAQFVLALTASLVARAYALFP